MKKCIFAVETRLKKCYVKKKIESYLEEWKRISPQSRTAIAKRYLRQLTGFGYIVARGGNRNRSYRMIGV